jgi:hypothetical protein
VRHIIAGFAAANCEGRVALVQERASAQLDETASTVGFQATLVRMSSDIEPVHSSMNSLRACHLHLLRVGQMIAVRNGLIVTAALA